MAPEFSLFELLVCTHYTVHIIMKVEFLPEISGWTVWLIVFSLSFNDIYVRVTEYRLSFTVAQNLMNEAAND